MAEVRLQRLKEKLTAHLRLRDDELLLAQGPAFPNRRGIRRLRMRVELGGYAERTYHEIASEQGIYSHRSVQLGEPQLAALRSSLRTALADQQFDGGDDPQGCYRTILFRDEGKTHELWVDYAKAPHDVAFAEAWSLIERQFPMIIDA